MKRILSTINKRPTGPALDGSSNYPQDSPESVVLREVTAFCEEGQGPNNPQGTEFVHLPSIVESAESSPNAAREAASLLRKLLSSPNSTASHVQYNAIMLVRILIDNPGPTFTRHLDAKFVSTIKDLLRHGKDMGVQRFLRETLDSLEIQRPWDEDLALLLQMWKKEKSKMAKLHSGRSKSREPRPRPVPPPHPHQHLNNFGNSERPDALPSPEELVARISESKTSAKLLMQFVQTTPPAEMMENDLIQEFSGRCRRASRAIQNYIHATNPAPDEDTLLTLIETNDELSVALSKHQRAMLQARKLLGQQGQSEQPVGQSPNSSDHQSTVSRAGAGLPITPPPALPQRSESTPSHSPPSPVSPVMPIIRSETTKTAHSDVSALSSNGTRGRYEYRSEDYQVQNPFADNYSIPSGLSAHAEDEDERLEERDRLNESKNQPVQHT